MHEKAFWKQVKAIWLCEKLMIIEPYSALDFNTVPDYEISK